MTETEAMEKKAEAGKSPVKKEKKASGKKRRRWSLRLLLVLLVVLFAILPFYYTNPEDVSSYGSKLVYLRDKAYALVKPDEEMEVLSGNDVLAEEIRQQGQLTTEVMEVMQIVKDEQSRIDDLSTRVSESSALEARVVKLEASVIDMETVNLLIRQLEFIEKKLEQVQMARSSHGLLLAISHLKYQLEQGRSFTYELFLLKQLAAGDGYVMDQLQFLEKYADKGIWTQERLNDRFEELSKPPKVSTLIPDELPWYEKLWLKVRSFVSIKRIDSSEDKVGIMTSIDKARTYLSKGNLQFAVEELSKNNGESVELLEWLEMASARLEAERVLDDIASRFIAVASERLK